MVQLRNALPDDSEFLFRVYRETNIGTFEPLGPELCEMMLNQQFSLQETQYTAQYPQLDRFIILSDGEPVGRLYLDKSGDKIILVNIAIRPAHQKMGIGTLVLLDRIKDSAANHRTIRLHVAQDNRAVAWYRKHGFKETGLQEPYIEMEYAD